MSQHGNLDGNRELASRGYASDQPGQTAVLSKLRFNYEAAR